MRKDTISQHKRAASEERRCECRLQVSQIGQVLQGLAALHWHTGSPTSAPPAPLSSHTSGLSFWERKRRRRKSNTSFFGQERRVGVERIAVVEGVVVRRQGGEWLFLECVWWVARIHCNLVLPFPIWSKYLFSSFSNNRQRVLTAVLICAWIVYASNHCEKAWIEPRTRQQL